MMSIVRTVIMAGATLGSASLLITIAEARQGAPKQEAAKGTLVEGRDAEASLDKARRALDDGKAETAQQLADAVLTSANKDTRNTARALAIRGEARLSLGRAVEAAADLDSALWLKGGLAGRDRELATAARSKAMQTGGIVSAAPPLPPSRVTSPAPQPAPVPAPAPVAVRAAPAPVPPQTVRATELPPARPVDQTPAWSSAVKAAPPSRTASVERAVAEPVPVQRQAAIAVSDTAPSSWSTAPTASPPIASNVDSPEPARPASGGGITGFFSGWFGGGQSGSQPESTGTVRPAAPRMPSVSSSEPQRLVPETRAARPSPPPSPPRDPVRAAAMVAPSNPAVAPVPSSPPTQSSEAEGMYKLQLAAVRSKAEAEDMARKVRAEDGELVGSRSVEIVEDVYGNMGRFYRVRIGPFPEPTQALSVCASLRDRRMDCMVLDR